MEESKKFNRVFLHLIGTLNSDTILAKTEVGGIRSYNGEAILGLNIFC